jgi:hypothetical protein
MFFGIFNKIKWILIIIVVIVIILFILKIFNLKPEVEKMISEEFSLAKKVFRARDIIHKQTSKDEEPAEKEEPEEKQENSNRKRPRRKNSKTSTYKREEICRKIFEDYFDDYFPTVRPKFLANPKTGRPLELDGYSAGLSLAFEHQGRQHYEYPNRFHKSEEEFKAQQERDLFKAKRCKELGIDLIFIPEYIPIDKIESFIMQELKKLGK